MKGKGHSAQLQGHSTAENFTFPHVGLLVRTPYVDWIIDGLKTWEIRTKRTQKRGRIALIRAKSGLVVGEAELVDVVGPLTYALLADNAKLMNVDRHDAWEPDVPTFAWVLRGAKRYATPIPYQHRSGAVIWARLP